MEETDEFRAFFERAEPPLRRALVAGYGVHTGRASAVEALTWAWHNWAQLASMSNPLGYLYRVGQTAARRVGDADRRQQRTAAAVAASATTEHTRADIDVSVLEIAPALESLSEQQRTAVVLVHGYGIPLRSVADLMDVSPATVREHTSRALTRLRRALEIDDDA